LITRFYYLPIYKLWYNLPEVINLPRYSREKSESGIFHVMFRGINRQTIFEDDEDRERFLETILHFKAISKYELYGYCLMSNHVHLLIKEIEDEISTSIKRISSSYVYWYNWKYGRCGHLFQERYKSEIVENDDYFITCLRYIHQNPVKAGLVKSVYEYKWSSYNEYIRNPVITDTDFALHMYSTNKEEAIVLFIDNTKEQKEDKCLDYYEKNRLSDNEVKEYFMENNFQSSSELQHMERVKRDEIIRKLKSIEGVTIRQLSRITGISKSVIDRI